MNLVSAVQINNPKLPLVQPFVTSTTTFNNNTGNVNSSAYWGSYYFGDYPMPTIKIFGYNQTTGAIAFCQANFLNSTQLNTTYVPYTGATRDVNLNQKNLSNVQSMGVNQSVLDGALLKLETGGGGTDALTPLFINSTNNEGFHEPILWTPAALRIANTIGGTATFRLLSSFSDVYMQDTDSSGTVHITGNNGVDVNGFLVHAVASKITGTLNIGSNLAASHTLDVNGTMNVTKNADFGANITLNINQSFCWGNCATAQHLISVNDTGRFDG